MKYFLIITSLIFVQKLFAQDPQLFENTWYLQDVIIDGNDNFPPSNEEVEFIQATFSNDNSFLTEVCATLEGTLSYNADNFSFDSFAITLIGCGEQVNDDYQNLYINDYFEQTIDNPYSYAITQSESALELTVTNSNNDIAIYTNELLSIENIRGFENRICPNPSNGIFSIKTPDNSDYIIIIYNVTGRVLGTIYDYTKNGAIDISQYDSGVYLLKIIDDTGNYSIERIIKN